MYVCTYHFACTYHFELLNDASTVTLATFGSPNITPCDAAASGTTNVTVNCKFMFLTRSGNNWIGTIAVLTSGGKTTSLTSALKNAFTIKMHCSQY